MTDNDHYYLFLQEKESTQTIMYLFQTVHMPILCIYLERSCALADSSSFNKQHELVGSFLGFQG